jgi:hypothetical protein
MSFAQLQRHLQAHVLHGSNEIESKIDSTESVSISTRLAIYSDAYRLRLIEALEGNYPVLAQLLGVDQFAAVAREYIDAHPSQNYSIRWFGHRVAEFFNVTRSDQPWLAELARWEWATAHAFDAADAIPLTQADVATLPPENWAGLMLRTSPSLTHLQLTSNIVAIVKTAAADEALPEPKSSPATDWCIWRQDLKVRYRQLDSAETQVIDALHHGIVFGELCERLMEHFPADDVPLRAATYLKQWLDEQWLCNT